MHGIIRSFSAAPVMIQKIAATGIDWKVVLLCFTVHFSVSSSRMRCNQIAKKTSNATENVIPE
jgi:hypothetical protein